MPGLGPGREGTGGMDNHQQGSGWATRRRGRSAHHRVAGALVALVALGFGAFGLGACARSGPHIREDDPPVALRFAPPPGMVLQERWSQRRSVQVDFPEGRTTVVEVHSGLSEETYTPLPGGGFRVSSVAIQANTLRNGEAVQAPLSLVGIPFVHVVDAEGRFVRAEELAETIEAMRKRLRSGPAREAVETLFEAETLRKQMEAAWNARFDQVCNRTLSPGDRFFVLDEQELPAGGPVVSVVEQLVKGRLEGRQGEAVELRLQFGGRRSPLARKPEARELLRGLEDGALALAERLEGEGERSVIANGCQTVREIARLRGEIRLNMEAARASGAVGLPERIRYRVDREVRRGPPGSSAVAEIR